MEERLQGNPVSEGIAYAKSYIYIPGTLTKAPEFFPKGQEEENIGNSGNPVKRQTVNW